MENLGKSKTIDDDGNGYTDDVYGWDFHSIPEDNQPDEGEHGTHVAGIVGAISNNNQGIAGVMELPTDGSSSAWRSRFFR